MEEGRGGRCFWETYVSRCLNIALVEATVVSSLKPKITTFWCYFHASWTCLWLNCQSPLRVSVLLFGHEVVIMNYWEDKMTKWNSLSFSNLFHQKVSLRVTAACPAGRDAPEDAGSLLDLLKVVERFCEIRDWCGSRFCEGRSPNSSCPEGPGSVDSAVILLLTKDAARLQKEMKLHIIVCVKQKEFNINTFLTFFI